MIFFDHLEHPLSQAVAEICQSKELQVVDVAGQGGLPMSLSRYGTPRAYVLSPLVTCEAGGLAKALHTPKAAREFTEQIHTDALRFLSDCRTATQAMMTQKAGQILFLGIDDVAARLVGLAETPIGNQLRVSGLKSLAKEYGRMGIRFNAVLSQPSKELAPPEVWRARREALKVYTMRFSPSETRDYADFCWGLLKEKTPLNGGVICLGKGVMEMAA